MSAPPDFPPCARARDLQHAWPELSRAFDKGAHGHVQQAAPPTWWADDLPLRTEQHVPEAREVVVEERLAWPRRRGDTAAVTALGGRTVQRLLADLADQLVRPEARATRSLEALLASSPSPSTLWLSGDVTPRGPWPRHVRVRRLECLLPVRAVLFPRDGALVWTSRGDGAELAWEHHPGDLDHVWLLGRAEVALHVADPAAVRVLPR